MIATVLLAVAGGFMIGNGLPYYVEGSAGRGVSPSPFPRTPRVNVVVGVAAMTIGAACTWLAGIPDHPVAGGTAFAAGLLGVGLIHAGNWTTNPWRRARASRGARRTRA